MAEKLLINVTVEETRVALVEGGVLSNLEIDTRQLVHAKGNIYKGVVHRVNQSLQAAFVDYGADKQGFLPVSEIHPRYYPEGVRGKRVPIQDVLKEKQELMVQVVKDEIGNKGASLSTYVSLPGRYLVLMPDSGKSGVSRKLQGEERRRLREAMDNLPVPEGFGVILRTAGMEREEIDLEQDLEYLTRLWNNLEERFKAQVGSGLIHRERSVALRFIRDYATSRIDELLVDDFDTYEEIRDFAKILMPEMQGRIRYYENANPLFSRYQVEDQIDDVFARRIDLPSGGSVVIDQTEALVAIDVNSGRVKTDDIEETALKTNLEASHEIARQLKLRDLGGLVVVDFIDMRSRDNIGAVELAARQAFDNDKAKVKFSRISEFGLMEISRQRLKSSITKGSFDSCHHCGGSGRLRSVESSALYLLRRLKETVIRGTNYNHVSAKMPVEVANYLLNRKRADLIELQKESKTTIDAHGVPDCPPNQAFVEILASSGRGKRPRRILLTFDLVRSDVERKELEEFDEVIVEAARARGVSLQEDEYADVYRALEEKMAAESDLMAAQRDSERAAGIAQALEEAEAQRKAQEDEPEPSVGLVGWVNRLLFGTAGRKPDKEVVVVEAPRISERASQPTSRRPSNRSGGRNRSSRNRNDAPTSVQRSSDNESSRNAKSAAQGKRQGRGQGGSNRNRNRRPSAGDDNRQRVSNDKSAASTAEAEPQKRRRRRKRRTTGAQSAGVESGSATLPSKEAADGSSATPAPSRPPADKPDVGKAPSPTRPPGSAAASADNKPDTDKKKAPKQQRSRRPSSAQTQKADDKTNTKGSDPESTPVVPRPGGVVDLRASISNPSPPTPTSKPTGAPRNRGNMADSAAENIGLSGSKD